MSNKRFILFVAVATVALAAFAFAGLPYMQLDFASAQYGYGSNNDDNSRKAPVDLNDPNVGEAAPGEVPVTNPGARAVLSPGSDLYDAPGGNIVIPGSANGGGQYPLNATDATGEWCRITISTESAWILCSSAVLIGDGGLGQ